MERYDELMAAVCQTADDRVIYDPLVRKAVLLEEKLEYLESLPHIVVHEKDPTKQKTTPAHKQYKELLQQYGNIIRILGRVTVEDENTAESPLRTWAKNRNDTNQKILDGRGLAPLPTGGHPANLGLVGEYP